MKNHLGFILLAAFLLSACNLPETSTPTPTPVPKYVGVYVYDKESERPIARAEVWIDVYSGVAPNQKYRTSDSGYALIPITWDTRQMAMVKVSAPKYEDYNETASLGPGEKYDAYLTPSNLTPSPTPSKTPETTRTSETPDVSSTPSETFVPTETPTISPLPTLSPTETPTIPPNRDQIAFASERVDGETPQVFIMNTDGSNQIQLIDMAGGTCQPEWSPDGRYLLFINPCDERNNFIYPNASIWIAEVDDFPTGLVDSSKIRPFIIFPGGAFDPDWSTSGIIFTGLKNGVAFIYLSNVEGKSTPVLLSSEFTMGDRQPDWSPDGKKIVFKRDVQNLIYYASVDGSDAISKPDGNLSSQGATYQGFPEFPSWSPDGNFIAYVTKDSEDSSKRIEVVRWDNHGFSPVVIIPSGAFGNTTPSWSPDGVWIVFASFPSESDNRYDIYKVISGGGQPFPLTDAPGDDYQPVWRPKP